MSTTYSRVRDIAAGEVSTTPKESPLGSNRTKYGAWYGWNGVAWCDIFISWVFAQAGGLDHVYGKHASVYLTHQEFKSRGKVGTAPKVGALAIFRNYSHIELVTGVVDADTIETIGGNTSWGTGSLSNGLYVAKRTRETSLIMAYCYPEYDYYRAIFPAVPTDGDLDVPTIKGLQAYLNYLPLGLADLEVDGVLGNLTLAALTKFLARPADRVWNEFDVRALQAKIGAPVDGQWGPITTASLQRYLNARRSILVEATP